MGNYLDMETLAALVRSKRLNRGLRETSAEIGTVSPSTISRVENGQIPDIDKFLALCDWLEISPASLIKNSSTTIDNTQEEVLNTPDRIAYLLQSDPNLNPAIASALASLIKSAYPDLCKY
jgi:transcriptional regulator with XRE-family HTH domain